MIKRSFSLLYVMAIMISVFVIGCKKDGQAAYQPSPSKREAGVPNGVEEQFPVDASGGVFTSGDKRVVIDVPKNIASPGTRIILQQITNTSPSSFGHAYRIFADKKLTGSFVVRLSYAGMEDSVGVNPLCQLGMAIQDTATGIWALQTGRSISEVGKYVSVTTSGGDCAFALPIRLTPEYSVIRPSGEVQLALVGNIILPSGDMCDIFGSGKQPVPLVEDYYLEPHLIDRWELLARGNGTGTLTALGNRASYRASAHELPGINPVTVLVFLKSSERPVSAKVFVQPDVNGLKIWIGSKEYVFNNDAVDLGINADGSMSMNWESNAGMGHMSWRNNTTGVFEWNSNNTQFLFEPADFIPLQALQSFYSDGTIVSAGDIRITATGTTGQKVSGSFIIEQAGRTNVESGNGEYLGASKVTGIFNLMRDF